MKKMKYMPLAALLLFSAACNRESINSNEGEDTSLPKIVITAQIDQDDVTKTKLEGVKLTWSEHDTIIVISKDDLASDSKKYGYYEIFEGYGTQKAKFQLVKGSAPSKTESGIYYACYCNDGCSFTIQNRSLFTYPETQAYVEGGIADGLLSMWGYGDGLDKLHFGHNSCVLNIPLYSKSSVNVSRLELTSSDGVSGAFYHSCTNDGFSLFSSNSSNKVTINFSGVEGLSLSQEEENPTCVRIVLPAVNLSNVSYAVYSTDGKSFFTKSKKSNLNPGPGVIYKLPVAEVKMEAIPNVNIVVGGDTTNIYSYGGKPVGNVKIVCPDGAVMSAQMEQIANILKRSDSLTVSLDLSAIDLNNNQFSNWFVGSYSLKSIELPKSMTSFVAKACFPSTIIDTIFIPEGVAEIPNSLLKGPACVAYLPSTVTSVAVGNQLTVTGFEVAESNGTYKSVDGVLFNKAGTWLRYYPGGKAGTEYTISCYAVQSNAFQGNNNIETLRFSKNTQKVQGMFTQMGKLNDIYLEGTKTSLSAITYNDSDVEKLFWLYGSEKAPRNIHVLSGCNYYRIHDVWKKFNTVFKWTFDDDCTDELDSSATIGELGTSEPSFEW